MSLNILAIFIVLAYLKKRRGSFLKQITNSVLPGYSIFQFNVVGIIYQIMNQNQVPQQKNPNRIIIQSLEAIKPVSNAFLERIAQQSSDRHYLRSPSRIQHISINAAKMASTSTSKIIRICSSGLNLYSTKTLHTQKSFNLKSMEFQSQNSISQISSSSNLRPSSSQGVLLKQTMQTSVDTSHYNYYVELSQKYNRKMIEQFRAQNDYWTAECDHLKKIIRNNESRAVDLQKKINDLQAKLAKKDKRYLAKLDSLQLGLEKFRTFYDKCHQYTIMRISDVQARIESLKLDLKAQMQGFEVSLPQILYQLKQKFIAVIGAQKINNLQNRLELSQILSDLTNETQLIKNKVNQIQQSQFKKGRISIKNQVILNQIHFFKQILEGWKISQNFKIIQCQQISQLPNSLQQLHNKQELQLSQKDKIFQLKHKIQLIQNNIEFISSKIREQREQCQRGQKRYKKTKNKFESQFSLSSYQGLSSDLSKDEDLNKQLEMQKSQNKQNLKQKYPKDRVQSYLKLLQQQQNYNLALQDKIKQLQQQLQPLRKKSLRVQAQDETKFLIIKNIFSFSFQGAKKPEEQKAKGDALNQAMMSLIGDNQKLRSLLKTMKTQRSLLQQQNNKLKRAISEYIGTFQNHSTSFQRKIRQLQMENSTLKSDNEKYLIQIRRLNHILQNSPSYDSEYKKERRMIKSKSGDLLVENKFSNLAINSPRKQTGFIVRSGDYRDHSKQFFNGQQATNPFADKKNVISQQKPLNSQISIEGAKKLQLLKNALTNSRFFIPTGCKIDETGFLKHAIYGSYIIDEEGNLIELTRQQQKAAVIQGLITLS